MKTWQAKGCCKGLTVLHHAKRQPVSYRVPNLTHVSYFFLQKGLKWLIDCLRLISFWSTNQLIDQSLQLSLEYKQQNSKHALSTWWTLEKQNIRKDSCWFLMLGRPVFWNIAGKKLTKGKISVLLRMDLSLTIRSNSLSTIDLASPIITDSAGFGSSSQAISTMTDTLMTLM